MPSANAKPREVLTLEERLWCRELGLDAQLVAATVVKYPVSAWTLLHLWRNMNYRRDVRGVPQGATLSAWGELAGQGIALPRREDYAEEAH